MSRFLASRRIPFLKSFLTRFTLLILLGQVFLVTASGSWFLKRASRVAEERAVSSSVSNLRVASAFMRSEFSSFAKTLNLLASTPTMSTFDPTEVGRLIKSYRVSSLFIAGEDVVLYDNDNHRVADNRMVGGMVADSGYFMFHKVDPLRPLVEPVEWIQGNPIKRIAVTVQNPARANGVLVAGLSLRRFNKFLEDYRVGENGFLFLCDQDGRLVHYPGLSGGRATLDSLGLSVPDPSSFRMDSSSATHFFTIAGREYLVAYQWDPDYRLGLFAALPKEEVVKQTSSVRSGMLLLLFAVLVVSTLIAIGGSLHLARPLHQLAERMGQFRDGNLDVTSGIRRGDEIGLLAEGFDEMREQIKKQIHELADHKEHLEEEVKARTEDLRKANRMLELMSHTDDLTGIPNRRDIMEKIHYEMYRSMRTRKPFVFLLGDIDKFKNFNDTYGHECGDYVLKQVAQAMRSSLRKHDYIARWGGEEFLIVLPETDVEGSLVVAERIRTSVEENSYQHGERRLRVTITLGVAAFDSRLGIERSIGLADRGLYLGKERGRNCVVVVETSPEDLAAAAAQPGNSSGTMPSLPITSDIQAAERAIETVDSEEKSRTQKDAAPKDDKKA